MSFKRCGVDHADFFTAIVVLTILTIVFGSIAYSGKSLATNICKEKYGNDYTVHSWGSEKVNCIKIITEPEDETIRESIVEKI